LFDGAALSAIILLIDSRIDALCSLISTPELHSTFSNVTNQLLTFCFNSCGRRESISSFATS
jgi:hypothetical protein